MKFKPIEYAGLVLEGLPCGIPLALDHIMSRKIRDDTRYLLDNPQNAKDLAMTTKQQLILDPQYKTFRYFDGVLTRRTKQSVKSALDKLEEMKRNELLNKSYPTLTKDTDVSTKDVQIRVISPETIQE